MNDKDFEKLVFGMAHQVRNPTAIIKSNAGVILEKERLSADARRSVESILNGVKYLEERLDEFVEFSKPPALVFKGVSLSKLLSEACAMIAEQCGVKKIKVSLGLSDITLKSADRNQLLVAILNILLNSIEAISAGGNVAVEARVSGGTAEVVVQDDGAGIHPRDLPEVFSPFYSTKPNSIGIGLPVAKRIIEAHLGTISVDSVHRKGPTVTVKLPIQRG